MSAIEPDGAAGPADPEFESPSAIPHRADYVLERGVWHVTCRVCGWQAESRVRRQIASMFRFHHRMQARLPDRDASERVVEPFNARMS
jgi:hypothetical protein